MIYRAGKEASMAGETALTVLTASQMTRLLEAEGLKVQIHGSQDVVADHLKDLEHADKNALTFYIGEESAKIDHLRDCVLICRPSVSPQSESVTSITTDSPKLAFYILAQAYAPPDPEPSIHPTAVIDPEASIHHTATIGPFCVVEKCTVGEQTLVHAHVTLYKNTTIGARVTVESNTCIGATGQIWAWGENGKKWILPQMGGTVINDDCFIGSNVSIVRGALQDTVINKGCRIAHGSRIGHNCTIGMETFISNGVTIPGSVTVGSFCFLGSGSVYRPGVILGDTITVGAGAVVTKSFPENGLILAGIPAAVVKTIDKNTTLAGVPKLPSSRVCDSGSSSDER